MNDALKYSDFFCAASTFPAFSFGHRQRIEFNDCIPRVSYFTLAITRMEKNIDVLAEIFCARTQITRVIKCMRSA